MELFVLYLWLKLDAVLGLMIGLIVLSGVTLFIGTIVAANEDLPYTEARDKDNRRIQHTWSTWPVTRWSTIVMAVALPTAVLMPSSKDAAILFGAHYAIKASEVPEGAKVMTLLRQRVNAYLDEALAEPAKKGD